MHHGTTFVLQNVRHVPKLTKSLLSIGQLDDLGYTTVFGNGSWLIRKNNLVIMKGRKNGSLYSMFVLRSTNTLSMLPSCHLLSCGIAG